MTMRTYWVAKSRRLGTFLGNGRVATPRLYTSEGMARANHRLWRETDEALNARLEFVEVQVAPAP